MLLFSTSIVFYMKMKLLYFLSAFTSCIYCDAIINHYYLLEFHLSQMKIVKYDREKCWNFHVHSLIYLWIILIKIKLSIDDLHICIIIVYTSYALHVYLYLIINVTITLFLYTLNYQGKEWKWINFKFYIIYYYPIDTLNSYNYRGERIFLTKSSSLSSNKTSLKLLLLNWF